MEQILASMLRLINGNSVMKISCVLCILTTFLSLECSAATRLGVSGNFQGVEGLKRFSEEIIDKFTVSFRKKMERQRIRHKRSNLQENEGKFHNVPVVLNSEPKLLSSTFSGHTVVSWCFSSLNKESLFAATKDGTIIFMDSELIPFFTFHSNIPIHELQVFEYNNRLWLICLHQNVQEYYFQVYEYQHYFMAIERNQQLKLNGQSVFNVINVHNSVFLAFASYNDQESTLSLYEWKNTMFDEIATLVLNGRTSSLTMWNMDRTIYIAASLANKNHSSIIKYNSIEGDKLTWVQQIEIENPLSVKSFEVFGNLYLIYKVVGSSFLFRWSGLQFIQWQKIASESDSKAAAGISTLKLLDQEIIAIAEKDKVEYYAQDDSSQYIRIGVTHVTERADLRKIFLWSQGLFHYLLPVFNEENYPAVVYQLNVTSQALSSRIYHDSLISCLNEVSASLNRNQEIINTVLNKKDKIWMRNKRLSVLSTVQVNGSINSNNINNINVILVTSKTVPNVLPSDLNQHLEILSNKKKLLISDIALTVSKSKNETINTNLKFSNLVNMSMGHIDKILNPTIINNIRITSHNLLTILGEQNFGHQTTVNHFVTEKATISGGVNSRTIEDFMLLRGTQFISGHITAQDINAKDISLKSNILNNVQLNDLVIGSLKQDIKGEKNFENLSSSNINSNGNVNNQNITKELENIVSINTEYIRMKVDFAPDVYIVGDITTERFTDPFDFHELVHASVKIYGDEEIKGDKTFLLPLEIEKDIILKSVNNIHFNDILTLNTAQNINGHFQLPQSTFFQKNIFTGTVNNIDFIKDVVTQQQNHVTAHIIFSKSLHVSDIEMSDWSTIESFDPSYEEQNILTIRNAIFNDTLSFKRVSITDELAISRNNSGFPLFNLLDNVWLKSKPQDIPFFKFKNMDVGHIEVGTINNLSTTNDFVLLSGNSVISSSKSFGKTKIQTMRFAPGVFFNGVDISALKVWLPSDDRKISDKINIKSITIEGDVEIFGLLNDLNVSNIMLTKLDQTCLGKNVFEFALFDHLETNHLSCDTFNNINFTSYAADSVLLKPSYVVLNKQFKIINGHELNINGQMHGYNFEDTIKRLVTLNTFQNLHPKVFSSDLKINTLFTKSLAEREFSDLENSVVLTDIRQENISRKSFQKTVWSNTFSVGEINEVNLTQLQKNSFSKKGNNVVRHDIIFVGNIDMQHVYVNNATIDGVDLQFLISLSKNLDLMSMDLKSIKVKNIEIMKLINGCNLTSIITNAVQLTKDEQVIDSFKFINSLKVIGNLYGKCSINGISLDYLNTSVISLVANRSISGNFFFKNVSIKYLNILQLSNDLDLTFLMNDAVTFKDTQVLKGMKTFKDLSLKVTFIDYLNISQELCDVNAATLFNTAVIKGTVQKLPAHTIHHFISNTVVLKGKLNDIKIPNELVLADKTETIHSKTIINSTLFLHSDLSVFGSIDGVQLLSFLNSRVTIFGNQRLVTSLTFLQDSILKKNVIIRGLLNKLKINKIVKRFSKQVISGEKIFKFNLTGKEIHIAKNINYINISNLSQSVVKINKNEDLSNILIFDAINTSSLLVSSMVGNISIFEIWDAMHSREAELIDILDSVAKKLHFYRELLFDFKDTHDYQVSTYGYFEQYQFMNISHSKNFFPVYEPPIIGEESDLVVSDMIMWIYEPELCKTGPKCCNDVYSYKMTILDNGSLAYREKTPGKIFHFNLKLQQEDVAGFVVQAYKRCSDNVSLIDIETLHYSNFETINTLVSPPNSTLLDARLLEVNEEIFIVIAFNFKGHGEKIYIYRYEVLNDAWLIHKLYYPWNPTSIDLVVSQANGIDTTYMAVTGYSSTPGIVVYKWLNDEHYFSEMQSVSTSVPGTVKWISQGSDLFLFHAKEKSKQQKENSWVDVYTEPIEVYSFSKGALELNHAINIQGIHMLDTLKFSDETYVLAASRHLQTIYVIQWRGYNGFEVIQHLQAPGVEGMAVYTASNNELLLAIASTTGHTKILKAQFRGPIKYLD